MIIMKQETQFTVKMTLEESELIRKASESIGLGHTSFVRMAALKEARSLNLDSKTLN